MKNRIRPYLENPFLRISYSLITPVYDLARSRSLQSLPTEVAGKVLLSGVGTGLDLPLLPTLHHYTALDFNAGSLSAQKDVVLDWM